MLFHIYCQIQANELELPLDDWHRKSYTAVFSLLSELMKAAYLCFNINIEIMNEMRHDRLLQLSGMDSSSSKEYKYNLYAKMKTCGRKKAVCG